MEWALLATAEPAMPTGGASMSEAVLLGVGVAFTIVLICLFVFIVRMAVREERSIDEQTDGGRES